MAPYPLKKQVVEKKKKPENPLIEKNPRNFGIGADIQPKRDLGRYVRWPKYVRIQRQRAILKKRLKVPPSINQFTKTLDKNTGKKFFHFISYLLFFIIFNSLKFYELMHYWIKILNYYYWRTNAKNNFFGNFLLNSFL